MDNSLEDRGVVHRTINLFAPSRYICLNVRHEKEGCHKRKEFCLPYRDVNDKRFKWLENDFIGYLNEWKDNIMNRPGTFSRNERAKMFLSAQTFEGLQITAFSLIEVTKFLLGHGVKYVFSERFCQDILEEYFGRQRSLGRFSDNPNNRLVEYQTMTIMNQRSAAPGTGNTKGRNGTRKAQWMELIINLKLKERQTDEF